MSALWGVVGANGRLLGRVPADWRPGPFSNLTLVPPEVADVTPLPDPYVPPEPEPVVARYIGAAELRERCEAAGIWASVAALLVQSPALMLTMLTSPEGVRSDDADARALIAAANGDPDTILG